jgi:hypothetical protein
LHIHFGIFRKSNGNLLAHFARLLSDFSNSRIYFGIFRKRNGCLLSEFTSSLSNFSNSRSHSRLASLSQVAAVFRLNQ